jgi:hypothetical protein
MQALVIANLSTLDAFTDHFGEEAGARLASVIYGKVEAFEGPVDVIFG